MLTFPSLFLVTAAVLLCGKLTASQDVIRNLQTDINSTHITFSWDIADGYYSSSYVSYFRIYYRDRAGYTGYYTHIGTIYYSYSTLIKKGSSFEYTTTVTTFGSFGQYVMWVYVYRPSRTPSTSYSEQIGVEVGRQIAIELNILLWPSQAYHEFTEMSTSIDTAVQNEVYWALRKYCHCTYLVINAIRLKNGYFTCSKSGYVTFRAHIYSTNVATDLSFVKSALTTWLHGQDTDKTITVMKKRYSVEPGPCGVTIPSLYAPECGQPTARVQ